VQANRLKQKKLTDCNCLNLGHGWRTSSAGHSRSTSAERRESQAYKIGGKEEPEECCAGLEFLASVLHVGSSVSQVVGDEIVLRNC
jgi:hypothetical protein